MLPQVRNDTPPSQAFLVARILTVEWFSQQNLQSRNLLTPLAPSGRHEMAGEGHQCPRSQSAQELVGLEFLTWNNTNETTLNRNSPPYPENNGCPSLVAKGMLWVLLILHCHNKDHVPFLCL